MPDRETTLRDLENLGAWHTHHYAPFHYEAAETIHNALAFLREQEPVKPVKEQIFSSIYGWVCGACSFPLLSDGYIYCPNCGKQVKWDA